VKRSVNFVAYPRSLTSLAETKGLSLPFPLR